MNVMYNNCTHSYALVCDYWRRKYNYNDYDATMRLITVKMLPPCGFNSGCCFHYTSILQFSKSSDQSNGWHQTFKYSFSNTIILLLTKFNIVKRLLKFHFGRQQTKLREKTMEPNTTLKSILFIHRLFVLIMMIFLCSPQYDKLPGLKPQSYLTTTTTTN